MGTMGGSRGMTTLREYLASGAALASPDDLEAGPLASIVLAIAALSVAIADEIRSPSPQVPEEPKTVASPDLATQALARALAGQGVRHLVSTEFRDPIVLDEQGGFSVALQPLAGVRDLDANAAAGTIFSVSTLDRPRALPADAELRAAGMVVYGPQTILVLTLGEDVALFSLGREPNGFLLREDKLRIPEFSRECAINAPHHPRWDAATRAFVDELSDSEARPNLETRYLSSLVADTFRILVRGGILVDAFTPRGEPESAGAHLLCEARPIALLVERAGGRASTGRTRILDLKAIGPHDRTPMILGSSAMVQKIERLYARPDNLADVSPLFGKRGLFRA
jgi:fructose-1,6-bisphosphatase I